MDILKLNNVLKFLFLLFVISTCVTCKDAKKNHENLCNNDSIIHLRNDKISLWFIDRYANISFQNIKIEQIRNGKIIYNLNYLIKKNRIKQIELVNFHSIRVSDSLKITCRNKNFFLYDFRNIPYYGGKKFLGCSLGSYKINGQEMGLIDWEILRVF